MLGFVPQLIAAKAAPTMEVSFSALFHGKVLPKGTKQISPGEVVLTWPGLMGW
jgi:hypothetical protein